MHVAGTVILPIYLALNSDIFNIQFFLTPQFALPCDGLLDLDSLVAHDISIHSKRRAIFSNECFHPAMDVNFPFLPSITTTSSDKKRLSTTVSPAPLPSSSEGKRSPSERSSVSAIVIGDNIGPSCATKFSVRLTNAPVGSHVISIPESMRLHRLCLESTISTVRTDHISDVLVTNEIGSLIHLKYGVALGTYEVLDSSSIEESLPLPVAGVNAQTSDVTDFADVIAPLMPHVNVLDYPEAFGPIQASNCLTRRTSWSDNPSHLPHCSSA